MNFRNPLLLIIPIVGLVSLILLFGPPSGFIGERAPAKSSAVLLLEFDGDCAGNQSAFLQLEFKDRDPVVLTKTYFDGGRCQFRFVLPTGELTGFTLFFRVARSAPSFNSARVVDQTGYEIGAVPLIPVEALMGEGPI